MQAKQQRQLDSLHRVQAFLDTHANVIGAVASSEGRKQLDAAVAALTGLGNDQGTADRQMAGQINREQAITKELKGQHMAPIATFARSRLPGVPDYAALIQTGGKLRRSHLVRAARTMATAASPHADALTKGGFPPDVIAQLGATADSLESVVKGRDNTRIARIEATKGIAKELRTGRDAVAMLHAVVGRQIVTDPALFAGWSAAKRVVLRQGAARVVASAPAVTPVPVAA